MPPVIAGLIPQIPIGDTLVTNRPATASPNVLVELVPNKVEKKAVRLPDGMLTLKKVLPAANAFVVTVFAATMLESSGLLPRLMSLIVMTTGVENLYLFCAAMEIAKLTALVTPAKV